MWGENGDKQAHHRHDGEGHGEGLGGIDVGCFVVAPREMDGRHHTNACGKHERHAQAEKENGGGDVYCCQGVAAYTLPNEDAIGKGKHGVEHQS